MNNGTRETDKKEEIKGCLVCTSKKYGTWSTAGILGSTDYLYYCSNCGTVRIKK